VLGVLHTFMRSKSFYDHPHGVFVSGWGRPCRESAQEQIQDKKLRILRISMAKKKLLAIVGCVALSCLLAVIVSVPLAAPFIIPASIMLCEGFDPFSRALITMNRTLTRCLPCRLFPRRLVWWRTCTTSRHGRCRQRRRGRARR
jgi:hypothetical protein